MHQRRSGRQKRKAREHEGLAGPRERQETHERRHHKIHAEIGDDPPMRLVIPLQGLGAGQPRQQVHAREVVRIVEERWQLHRQDRQRRQQEQHGEGAPEACRAHGRSIAGIRGGGRSGRLAGP